MAIFPAETGRGISRTESAEKCSLVAHDAQTIESCLFASLTQHRLLWRLVSVTGPRRDLQT